MRYKTNWYALQHSSPVDISRVTDLAYRIERKVKSIDIDRMGVEKAKKRALEIRGALNVLIARFIEIVRRGIRLKNKRDWFIYSKVERDFRSLLKNLDKRESETVKITSENKILIIDYINQIETILYSIIYDSLFVSIQEVKNESVPSIKFLYALWGCIERKSGLFSGETAPKQQSTTGETTINDWRILFQESEKETPKNEEVQEVPFNV